MRMATLAITTMAISISLAAQTPPTQPPTGTQEVAPVQTVVPPNPTTALSAEVAAPPTVLRIFVDNLQGSDAAAIAGLITQSLFESRQVVVTYTESNASLVLKGRVEREAVPQVGRASSSARRRGSQPSSTSTAPADSTGIELPPLPGLDSATDLSKYLYRLELVVVNPQGDLVWMNGRGREALPFGRADEAVSRTLAPLLQTLPQLKGSPAAGH